MKQKEIKISQSLSGILEQMDENQVAIVQDMFSFYMEQYQELRLNNNAESVSAAIHDSVSEFIDETISESKHTSTCSKGCSFCCFQRVDISDDEATLIISYSKEIGFEIDLETLKHQQHAKSDIEFSILPTILKRCVFLDKKGECSIYKHRPSSCRKLVVMSDPKLCDTVSNPNGEIGKIVSLEAEVITSSSLNVRDFGSMSEMILKQLYKAD